VINIFWRRGRLGDGEAREKGRKGEREKLRS